MSTVHVNGCIDLNTAPDLQRNLMRRLTTDQSLRLDMSRVAWIDSAGLASLVKLLAEARRRGGDLIVAGANEAVEGMLKLARLDVLFPVSREQASNADQSAAAFPESRSST